MRIAFVYDRINKIGGAERILTNLHQLWPQAPWFTAVYNPGTAKFAKNWHINTSFLQHFRLARTKHELFPQLMPFAFESFDFSQFNVVVSITSAEAKGIITSPKTLHICYCLTPTRYLYSHRSTYQNQGLNLLKPIKKILLNSLRSWDQVAAQRPDYYLAISNTVKQRIKKYYHRDSQLLYPPVNTDFFKPAMNYKLQATSYYLVVSRLVAYKRIDLAIKACNQLKLPLYIVGQGQEEKTLRKIAGPTIKFVGKLTDIKLLSYYQNCAALIFPGEEDFGLSMAEAQATGKPVIAYKRGGAVEIIKNNKTGLLFDKLTVSSLKNALTKFSQTKFNLSTIRQNALKFNQDKFKQQFKQIINTLWQKYQTNLL